MPKAKKLKCAMFTRLAAALAKPSESMGGSWLSACYPLVTLFAGVCIGVFGTMACMSTSDPFSIGGTQLTSSTSTQQTLVRAVKGAVQKEIHLAFEKHDARDVGSTSTSGLDERLRKRALHIVKRALTGDLLMTNGLAAGEKPFDQQHRDRQGDCTFCYSMIGNNRMDQLHNCVVSALKAGVQGDFVETGVWRGGASIFAKTIMQFYAPQQDRRVYACDSFAGLPKAQDPHDQDWWSTQAWFVASEASVRENFKRFNVLSDDVRFIKGYFQDTLPVLKAQMEKEGRKIMVLRGDGDMFSSYKHTLNNLYGLLNVGGYFICDDCPGVREAMMAVEEFRSHHGIQEEFIGIPGNTYGMYWRKTKDVQVDYAAYRKWASNTSKTSIQKLLGR